MAKRTIRGIAGDYENYRIDRYPVRGKAKNLENPYQFDDIPGNIVCFTDKKTDEWEYRFIPSFYTEDVLKIFNDPNKTDVDLYNFCKGLKKAHKTEWGYQSFALEW